MNILLVSDTYKPQVNGLVTAIETQINALKRRGINVFLLVPSLKKYHQENILTSFALTYPFFPEYKLPFIFSLKNLCKIKKLKIDIIHSHTPFSLGIFAIILSRLLNIPVIHTYHTYFEEYTHYAKLPKKIGRIFAILFSKWYCSRMDHIITPSLFMKNTLQSYGIKKEISILPTGYDLKIFKHKKHINYRRKFGIPEKAKVLLYVGRISKEKNLYSLIDMFKNLRSKYNNIFMVITGEGPEKKSLEKYIKKLYLSKNIKTTGLIDFQSIHNIYSTGDIFVFPSKTETQGLVLIEAMLNSLPIVSFYERGTQAVLPSKKILGISPVQTEAKFIKEVEFYLNEKYNKIALINNLKKYVKRFDEEDIIEELLSIYIKNIVK